MFLHHCVLYYIMKRTNAWCERINLLMLRVMRAVVSPFTKPSVAFLICLIRAVLEQSCEREVEIMLRYVMFVHIYISEERTLCSCL